MLFSTSYYESTLFQLYCELWCAQLGKCSLSLLSKVHMEADGAVTKEGASSYSSMLRVSNKVTEQRNFWTIMFYKLDTSCVWATRWCIHPCLPGLLTTMIFTTHHTYSLTTQTLSHCRPCVRQGAIGKVGSIDQTQILIVRIFKSNSRNVTFSHKKTITMKYHHTLYYCRIAKIQNTDTKCWWRFIQKIYLYIHLMYMLYMNE